MEAYILPVLGVLATIIQLLGVATALHAIMGVRTAQGSIAWAISLVTFPWFALPMYWIFGRNKFQGYADTRRLGDLEIHHVVQKAGSSAREDRLIVDVTDANLKVFERLAKMPFLHANRVGLLVNGDATFGAIFAGIDSAKDYVLVQFFIVHDDQIGRELKNRLIKKATDGVRVYFLYDEIGCHKLPNRYIRELSDAGVEIHEFNTRKGLTNRFQINFRNHRKIVVVDGQMAFVGGLNVGDEYMGRSKRFGPWRDTHVKIEGPAVHAVQLSFLEDWYWATRKSLNVDWKPRASNAGRQQVLVLPSGPADELETCALFFVHAIHSAKQRIWIASPYFVPDRQVITALQLAALRGVDVRILLPDRPDHKLVYLSSFSFLDEAEQSGVAIYRYLDGFMHHKVVLIDDDLAAVGTANLDNRSFRLNFEITILVHDHQFAGEVSEMLERDFADSRLARTEDLLDRSFCFKIAVRIARLMAPLQ